MSICVKEYVSYKSVTYYTLVTEETGAKSIDDFLNRMSSIPELKDNLDRLMYLIKSMGDRHLGISFDELRLERGCSALPPSKVRGIDLRLYCYWVSERIVILFNGDCKTPGINKAEDCPRVGKYFQQAQSWSKKIEEIRVEHDGVKITNLDFLNF